MNSLLKTLIDRATTPLAPQVGQAGDTAADMITTPKLDENPNVARLKGFGAGAVSGAGHLISDMTSPMALTGLLGSGGVGSKLLSMAGNAATNQLGARAVGATAEPSISPSPMHVPTGGEELYNLAKQPIKHRFLDPVEQTYLRILAKGGR